MPHRIHKCTNTKFEVILTVHRRYYMEIKCQLDATDDIYCRFYTNTVYDYAIINY